MKKILILCTGNSCRSQMAEGLGNSLKGNEYTFYSAGTKTHGLNQNAVKVMAEIGIDIKSHVSKTIEDLDKNIQFDVVITVCSDAHENCPYFPGKKVVHKGFDDPPRIAKEISLLEKIDEDSNSEKLLEPYRRVRDEIKEFIMNIESFIN